MDSPETTTLDYIDDIVVLGRVFEKPANEYWALVCLWNGMEYLNRQILKCEQGVKDNINSGAKIFSFMDEKFEAENLWLKGNSEALKGLPQALVTTSFHWYAISACQFVRLIGAIGHAQDNSLPLPNIYAEKVIPEVLLFRNKVAAHFAWSTRNDRDTDAERMASILPPLEYSRARLRVGGIALTIKRGSKVSTGTMPEWSLTEVHEELAKRYLPPRPEVDGDASQLASDSETSEQASDSPTSEDRRP